MMASIPAVAVVAPPAPVQDDPWYSLAHWYNKLILLIVVLALAYAIYAKYGAPVVGLGMPVVGGGRRMRMRR